MEVPPWDFKVNTERIFAYAFDVCLSQAEATHFKKRAEATTVRVSEFPASLYLYNNRELIRNRLHLKALGHKPPGHNPQDKTFWTETPRAKKLQDTPLQKICVWSEFFCKKRGSHLSLNC